MNYKKQLKQQRESFVNSSEKSFFLGVANYIEFIIETPPLKKIAEYLLKKREEKITKYQEQRKTFRKDLEHSAERLFEKASEKDIKKIGFKKHEYDLRDFQKKAEKDKENMIIRDREKMTLIEDKEDLIKGKFREGYVDSYFEKFRATIFEAPSEIVSEFKEESDVKTTSDLLDRYEEIKRKRRKLNLEAEKAPCNLWARLYLVYILINKEKEFLEPTKNFFLRKGINKGSFLELIEEIDKVLNKEESKFKKADYLPYLNQVHNYFLKRLTGDKKDKKREGNDEKEKIKEITLISMKRNKNEYKIVINKNWQSAKPLQSKGKWTNEFIRAIKNKKNSKEVDPPLKISKDMAEYYHYNDKCVLYSSGQYAHTEIFSGYGQDPKINSEIKVKIISEDKFQKLKDSSS